MSEIEPTTPLGPPPGPTGPSQGPPQPPQGPLTPEARDAASPVSRGFLARLAVRAFGDPEARRQMHDEDAEAYRYAGESTMGKLGPQEGARAYDPLAKWNSKHRAKRQGWGFEPDAEHIERYYGGVARPSDQHPAWPDPTDTEHPRARNTPQELAELRANMRSDVIKTLNTEQQRMLEIYGEVLFDENAVEEMIRGGRFTRLEAKGIRSAGRAVRKKQRVIDRVGGRLQRQAEGEDWASTYARRRSER